MEQRETYPLNELFLFKVYQTRQDYINDHPKVITMPEDEWYTSNIPEKSWYDPAALMALEDDLPYKVFIYDVAEVVNGKPVVNKMALPAFIAARINIPKKEATNEVPPEMAGKIVPVPIRELSPDEGLELGTFGVIRVFNKRVREELAEQKETFTVKDRQMLRELYTMVKESLGR